MSAPSLAIKTNSVHPGNMEENDAIKLLKRAKKRNNRDTTLRMRTVSNRVPDETMNLEDTVLNMDTSAVLFLIGVFKLLLLTPLLILGVVLISMKTSGKNYFNVTENKSSVVMTAEINPDVTVQPPRDETDAIYENLYNLRNDSVAPIWTAIMLGGSSIMDFISANERAGNTIIVYMLISTVAFVACILCIEYDRIEMTSIDLLTDRGFTSLSLHRDLYFACIFFAGAGVALGVLSIYVGSRMAELEQFRLYMERDGLPAVLSKKDGSVRRFVLAVAKRLHLHCYVDMETMESTAEDTMTIQNESTQNENERHVTFASKEA